LAAAGLVEQAEQPAVDELTAAYPPCSCSVMQWFEDLGGFEREENIDIFVQWAIKAVELFGSRILYWATFNEPTVS